MRHTLSWSDLDPGNDGPCRVNLVFVDDDRCGLGDYHDLAVMVEVPVKNKGTCAHMKEHGTYLLPSVHAVATSSYRIPAIGRWV